MLSSMNVRRLAIVLCAAATAGMAAAHAGNPSEEYNQVKKIALKDPKVRAAFARANAELEKRILEIDPSLKPFVEKERGPKSQALPTKKSSVKTTHTVAKGETLTSIARHYKVGVQSLLEANHISKQATLKVGQKLTIPTGA
jgi:N-acetylmuramoyl-L-alanine amidase